MSRPLYIYNTLSREKEEFKPIDRKNVRLYACGPTVYNYAHIGNARPAVVFDLLAKVLRYIYGRRHVTYTRNITDIDDKIIAAAKETGAEISAITEKYAKIYDEDMAALGVEKPDHQPKATDYIGPMVRMIKKLIDAGHAYEAEGHVLFNVPSWPDYGRLSRRNRDDMVAGARVEVAPYKKDPADFVLWKPSTGDQPGWDSPWGRGRPGWHLECSAMNESINGDHFDIHAGGEDLIFPHHENEIAQSVCAHGGEAYVNYWMHNGYLMAEGEKMSKSLGNFYTVHELLDEFPGEAIRLLLLKTHYRQPLDFTKEGLAEAKRELDGWYRLKADAGHVPPALIETLCDDLNTPGAIAALHKLSGNPGALTAGANFIGLLQQDPEDWFKWQPKAAAGGLTDADIDAKIEARTNARKNKDFATSDAIRDELAAAGVILEDGAGGTTWRRG
ncbi:MAG: cysteine--tRNA ligase [Alphaproteobacteria bacterium]|nr:cysteine--tRNA ligase [Alphaproteobacteria bacterium]